MAGRDAYVALMASLPSSERLFFAKQPPMSRLRLDKRLRVLSTEEAAVLAIVEGVLSWRSYAMSATGEAAQRRIDAALTQIPQPTLQAALRERIDLRQVMAALRQRAQGHPAPVAPNAYGRLTRRIVQNWSDPAFKLGRHLPWVPEAAELIAAQAPKKLERHILQVTFGQLQRFGTAHQFDFEAVALYVLKWNIFDRWARLDAKAASARFDALADAALADGPPPDMKGAVDARAS
ncbi:MAG: hypothetical protein AAFR46_07915 [Pseudomonadota bacterium]